ncbi:hypothetical protein BSIN_3242 [Burkholderia singularis]|uniref:Uncharacterized protein n=1 Tax=Burkholderia singularis TaxID=1503053 RepID=A0A238H497_9BURK|nr:hypothetical protein BSIN_3242 [Burkholderia singularis]
MNCELRAHTFARAMTANRRGPDVYRYAPAAIHHSSVRR